MECFPNKDSFLLGEICAEVLEDSSPQAVSVTPSSQPAPEVLEEQWLQWGELRSVGDERVNYRSVQWGMFQ